MPEDKVAAPPSNQPAGGDQGDPAKVTPPKGDAANVDPATLTPEQQEAAKVANEAKVKADAEAKAKAATDAKAKEEAAKAAVVSADKLILPKDSLIPKTRLEEIAKEQNITLEQAQKRVDQEVAVETAIKVNSSASLLATKEKWIAEIKSDPVLGGENFNQTNQLATRAFRTLFGDEEFAAFSQSIFSTKPGLIRGLVNFAKQVGDSALIAGDPPASSGENLSLGERVYGKGYNPVAAGGGQPDK